MQWVSLQTLAAPVTFLVHYHLHLFSNEGLPYGFSKQFIFNFCKIVIASECRLIDYAYMAMQRLHPTAGCAVARRVDTSLG